MPKFYNHIEWDELEQRWTGLHGELYKTIDDIPESIRHLVKPIKPIKPFKLRCVMRHRSSSC